MVAPIIAAVVAWAVQEYGPQVAAAIRPAINRAVREGRAMTTAQLKALVRKEAAKAKKKAGRKRVVKAKLTKGGRRGIMVDYEEAVLLGMWSEVSQPTWDALGDHLGKTYPGLNVTKEEQSVRHLLRLTPRQARTLVRGDFGPSTVRSDNLVREGLLRRLGAFIRESSEATVGGKYRISLLKKKRKRGKKRGKK